MADKFLVTPMDYTSGPENPKPPGEYNGEPGYPKRTYSNGVTEKTLESGDKYAIDKSDAMGSPVIDKPTK